MKKIYLTIDDFPSLHTQSKVDFLCKNRIPAVFYCRGEHGEKYQDSMVYAIEKGFLVGNHTWSHPFFSQISLPHCFDEILKTQTFIDLCYKKAGVEQPTKTVRLPFGDRGAGGFGRLPSNDAEQEKVAAIQAFLQREKFVPLASQDGERLDEHIDFHWTWDSKDYRRPMIDNPDKYLKKFKTDFLASRRKQEVLLVHDFDHNDHLFQPAIEFLLEQGCNFALPRAVDL